MEWLTERGNCFIEFTVDDSQRFRIFLKLFNTLKTVIRSHGHLEFSVGNENNLMVVHTAPSAPVVEPSGQVYSTFQDWLTVFDASDLAYLGLPTHEDSSIQLIKWANVPQDVTDIQEENVDKLLNVLTDIKDAITSGEPIIPLHERMAEFGKETEAALKNYQDGLQKEMDGNPPLKKLKEFADVVGSFEEITFELETCQLIDTDHARLEFFSSGFPYGGRYALEELLMFFSFVDVIADNC